VGSRVPGYERIATGHLAAAFAVATGAADCCIASSSAARCYGLRFLPLRQERFDLTFRRTFAESNAGKVLLDVLNQGALRRDLWSLAGYDTADTGRRLL
jgi:molybdate-binding protein